MRSLFENYSPSGKLFKATAIGVGITCLAIASHGIHTNYSYWLDELYSVTNALKDWHQLGRNLLTDVHPPLYQIILKSWISFFGSSEATTRLLSFGFAVGTIAALTYAAFQSAQHRRLLALSLIGLSPAFTFYSQETRSYSLALMLSTFATLSAINLRANNLSFNTTETSVTHPRHERLIYYGSCLALSLTHYFGWIYVFCLSCYNLVERRIEISRLKTLLLMCTISIWPIIHIAAGSIINVTGGNFWIKVSPPIIGTVDFYLQGCLPFLRSSSPVALFNLLFLVTALVVLHMIPSHDNCKKDIVEIASLKETKSELTFLIVLIYSMVTLVSFVDIHTPMSTPRNYIVLLPPTMIGLSDWIIILSKSIFAPKLSKVLSVYFTILILLFLGNESATQLESKLIPHQNWKQLAIYVKESNACAKGCYSIGSRRLHDYYFRNTNFIINVDAEQHLGKLQMGSKAGMVEEKTKLATGSDDIRIIGFHDAGRHLGKIFKYRSDSDKYICLSPKQHWAMSTFIIIPKSELSGKEGSLNMSICPRV